MSLVHHTPLQIQYFHQQGVSACLLLSDGRQVPQPQSAYRSIRTADLLGTSLHSRSCMRRLTQLHTYFQQVLAAAWNPTQQCNQPSAQPYQACCASSLLISISVTPSIPQWDWCQHVVGISRGRVTMHEVACGQKSVPKDPRIVTKDPKDPVCFVCQTPLPG